MKYLFMLGALVLFSCDQEERPHLTASLPLAPYMEAGPELTEKGKVVEVAFRLGSSTVTTNQSPGYEKTIAKSFLDDPLGLHSKTVRVPSTNATNTVKVEDQFAVVFECQHGKFIIEDLGKESRAGQLWKKLKQGDPVTIKYTEVYRIVPATNEKTLVKYDFIDANVAKD